MIPILYVLSPSHDAEEILRSHHMDNDMKSWERVDLELEKERIAIEHVRAFIKHIENGKSALKLAIIPELHTAKTESQNALLKLVEEIGSTSIQCIGFTRDEYSLIPTLRSRFSIKYIENVSTKKTALRKRMVISQSLAENMAAGEGRTKEQALQMLTDVMQQLRTEKSSTNLLHELIELYDLVSRNNVNPESALDVVAIKLTLS